MRSFSWAWPRLLLILAHAFVGIGASHADPSIDILSVPTYASPGVLEGIATGVNPQDYDVATYIHVEGFGWSTKPTLTTRTVPLNADGTFSVPFGPAFLLDNRATIFATALVPKGYTPPAAAASGRIPAGLNSVAIDYQQRFFANGRFCRSSMGHQGISRQCRSREEQFLEFTAGHLGRPARFASDVEESQQPLVGDRGDQHSTARLRHLHRADEQSSRLARSRGDVWCVYMGCVRR